MSLFFNGLEQFLLKALAVSIIAFFVIPVHEFAHSYMAYRLGDDTAKRMGRLTLAPLEHIDIIGTLMMLLIGVGWGKPVPVNYDNFKRKKLYTALVALAGPLSNILAALLGGVIFNAVIVFVHNMNNDIFYMVQIFFQYYIMINLASAVFNMIPLPPLDGSKILMSFIPDRILDSFFEKVYRYKFIIFILIFFFLSSSLLRVPMYMIQNWLFGWVMWLTSLPFRLVSF